MMPKQLVAWSSVGLLGLLMSGQNVEPLTQPQAAYRFAQAALRTDEALVRTLLEPAVARQVSPAQLRQVLARTQSPRQQFGDAIELHKLGLRLSERGQLRYFCSFTFKNDTLPGAPHVQLDVTFRDSVTTQVQYFTLVPTLPGAATLPLDF